MGEIGHLVAVHLQIDGDGRAAEPRKGGRRGVRIGEPSDPRDVAGQFNDAAIIDVVEHCQIAVRDGCVQVGTDKLYRYLPGGRDSSYRRVMQAATDYYAR